MKLISIKMLVALLFVFLISMDSTKTMSSDTAHRILYEIDGLRDINYFDTTIFLGLTEKEEELMMIEEGVFYLKDTLSFEIEELKIKEKELEYLLMVLKDKKSNL